MRLLFDQNLSRRLVADLAPWFPDSAHVGSIGLDTATDREVWAYAGEQGYMIASKDSDFRQLAFLFGPPPKGIWFRVGNCSTAAIAAVLRSNEDASPGSPRRRKSRCSYCPISIAEPPQACALPPASEAGDVLVMDEVGEGRPLVVGHVRHETVAWLGVHLASRMWAIW